MATGRSNTRQRVNAPWRFGLDRTWRRLGSDRAMVLAGSPPSLFRLTPAGVEAADALEQGAAMRPSSLTDRLIDAGAIHPVPPDEPTHSDNDVTVITPQLGGSITDDGRIVVDDGSSPPLAGATVRLEFNSGPGAARNAGRSRASTSLLAFVDADVDLGATGDWLGPLLGHFDDPHVALVAPRVAGEANSPLDLGRQPARVRAGSRVGYVPAAAVVVRAEAFDAVGGFDEQLRFGEDVDFVWRLDDAGWRCRYEPASVVQHAPRPSFTARLQQNAGYGSSAPPLSLRHPQSLAPVKMSRWNAAGWGLAALGHPLLGIASVLGGTYTLRRKLADLPLQPVAELAARSQIDNAKQLASAVRRVWWPIVAMGAVVSRRTRWIAVAAAAASPATAANDVAYGWGVWRGMRRHRTARPIVPDIS